MIILSTGSLYTYGTARVFELAAETGFDGIEVLIDHRPDTWQADYLRRLLEMYGLPILALHSPFGYVPDWEQGPVAYLERTVALAQSLGVPVVVQHLPFRMNDMAIRWQGFLNGYLRVFFPWQRKDSLYRLMTDGRLEALERSSGVTIAVENLPRRAVLGVSLPLYWFNTPDAIIRFKRLTFDTTHVGTWGWNLLDVYERIKANVAHVHLSNFDGKEHRLPMDGRLPLAELLGRLARDRFGGAVSVECHPDAFKAQDEQACRKALAQTLAFCREHFRIAA